MGRLAGATLLEKGNTMQVTTLQALHHARQALNASLWALAYAADGDMDMARINLTIARNHHDKAEELKECAQA